MQLNARVENEIIEMFDRVAKKHQRDRTKELKAVMIEAIQKEFPDWNPPEIE